MTPNLTIVTEVMYTELAYAFFTLTFGEGKRLADVRTGHGLAPEGFNCVAFVSQHGVRSLVSMTPENQIHWEYNVPAIVTQQRLMVWRGMVSETLDELIQQKRIEPPRIYRVDYEGPDDLLRVPS